MKVSVFIFKNNDVEAEFKYHNESNNFIVNQYMNSGEDGLVELHLSTGSMRMADKDGYISRYIVNGEFYELIDEINSITTDDFGELFVWVRDYDLDIEDVKSPTIDENELFSTIMNDLDKPIKPVTVEIEKLVDEPRINTDSPWNMTGVIDLRQQPKDPTEYMIQTIADVMDKAQQYEMTITKGREGKQCLQLKVEW